MRIRKLAFVTVSLLVLAACHRTPQPSDNETSAEASASAPAPEVHKVPPIADQPLACDYPVAHDATAESLLAKYGDDAVVGKLNGDDGFITDGVILYRGYAEQRIEVTFWDKKMQHIRAVRLGEDATAWKGPQGLHYGSTIGEVAGDNGNLTLSGYSYEDGGYVANLDGGPLASLPGGCKLNLRISPLRSERNSVPFGDPGDDEVTPNDERLKDLHLSVSRMQIAWPKP